MTKNGDIKKFFNSVAPSVQFQHSGARGDPRPSKTLHSQNSKLENTTSQESATKAGRPEALKHPSRVSPSLDTVAKPTTKEAMESSFDSISTSFTGSQRVTKNGEVMITNSDEESDSDSSLEDIDELLTHNPASAITDINESTTMEFERAMPARVTRSMYHSRVPKTIQNRAIHKFSLDSIAAIMERNRCSEFSIEEALRSAGESDKRIKALEGKLTNGSINEDKDHRALASIMVGRQDGTDVERIVQAMERTEALQSKKRWSFFASTTVNDKTPEFPDLNGTFYAEILSNKLDREAAFMSGFMEELAAKASLPNDLLAWIIDTALVEPRDDLQEAYCSVVRISAHQRALMLTTEQLEIWFHCLGASEEALDKDRVVEPCTMPTWEAVTRRKGWESLKNLLRLLSAAAYGLCQETCARALSLLFRLAVDAEFEAHADLLLALHDTILALFESLPDAQTELQISSQTVDLTTHVKDKQLRLQLLRNLTAPYKLLCKLRRRLALAFFSESMNKPLNFQEQVISLTDIFTLLSRREFRIRPDTDFTGLTAMVAILDIGVDDGRPYLRAGTNAENLFNEHIDQLAQMIKSISTKIRDTGANHLARTEAKEAMESLHARLEYAVRTKAKPKMSVFDAIDRRPNLEEKKFMEKFILRKDH